MEVDLSLIKNNMDDILNKWQSKTEDEFSLFDTTRSRSTVSSDDLLLNITKIINSGELLKKLDIYDANRRDELFSIIDEITSLHF